MRRQLPGVEVDDYQFETYSETISLSDLFGDKSELIVVNNMGKGYRYCALWGEGLDLELLPTAKSRMEKITGIRVQDLVQEIISVICGISSIYFHLE
ncbi:MAG: hypothetical protein ACI84C_002842 [Flavobacteriales bacterium]